MRDRMRLFLWQMSSLDEELDRRSTTLASGTLGRFGGDACPITDTA